MEPTANGYSVRAPCPDCGGALSNWDMKGDRQEFGTIIKEGAHRFRDIRHERVLYKLLRCSGCGRGGVAKFHDSGRLPAVLEWFVPRTIPVAALPAGVPDAIANEYREAELCTSVSAWRGASALLRSALEKTLKANGYKKGTLEAKIDEAAADGLITPARKQKAHDDVRVLGNEVVHDEWREITSAEVQTALHYVQRVLEDFYDDRPTVEAMLRNKMRLPEAEKSAS